MDDGMLEALGNELRGQVMTLLGHPAYMRLEDDPVIPEWQAEHIADDVRHAFFKAFYLSEFMRMRKENGTNGPNGGSGGGS